MSGGWSKSTYVRLVAITSDVAVAVTVVVVRGVEVVVTVVGGPSMQ